MLYKILCDKNILAPGVGNMRSFSIYLGFNVSNLIVYLWGKIHILKKTRCVYISMCLSLYYNKYEDNLTYGHLVLSMHLRDCVMVPREQINILKS